MAYDTKDMNEIANLLDKVEKKHIATPQQSRQRVYAGLSKETPNESQVVSESVTPTKEKEVTEPKLSKAAEINKALEEAGLGESINYYQDKLEYITEPNYELHAVDIDEERGDIELEFTYKKTRDTYSISYNHFDGKMSVGVASDGDEKYKIIDADDFRKSDYHDTIYTAMELEIDNLSRFINEEPDDVDYEDDE